MKGGKGPALDIWSKVLRRLNEEMAPFENEDDSFEINPDKYNAKHEQEIFLEILTELTKSRQMKVLNLDRCLYASGLWYEYRTKHTQRCGSIVPAVLNNNWIQGNHVKIQRARENKHWFLEGDALSSEGRTCVADWVTAMTATIDSFGGRPLWSEFPIPLRELSLLRAQFHSVSSSLSREKDAGELTSAFPFVSGEGFEHMCPLRCEKNGACAFSPDQVNPGDCIYIATRESQTLAPTDKYVFAYRSILPKIRSPHVVITYEGNSPISVGNGWHQAQGNIWSRDTFSLLLDDPMIVGWFASTCHWKTKLPIPKKLHCIPLGFDSGYNKRGLFGTYLAWMEFRSGVEPTKLLFSPLQASKRTDLSQATAMGDVNTTWITRTELIAGKPGSLNYDAYIRVLQDHFFVACPTIDHHDSHCLWEAIIAGSYPVVISTPRNAVYIDLPVLVVQAWADVTESFLRQSLALFQRRRDWNTRKIFFSWWKEVIGKAAREKPLLINPVKLQVSSSESMRPWGLTRSESTCLGKPGYLASAKCMLSSLATIDDSQNNTQAETGT